MIIFHYVNYSSLKGTSLYKALVDQTTNGGLILFVNDNLDVDTLGCPLSPLLYRGTVNSLIELWTVNHINEKSDV
jgi:hypothetical protein